MVNPTINLTTMGIASHMIFMKQRVIIITKIGIDRDKSMRVKYAGIFNFRVFPNLNL